MDQKCVLSSKLLEQHAFRTQSSTDPPHTMLGTEARTHKEEESLKHGPCSNLNGLVLCKLDKYLRKKVRVSQKKGHKQDMTYFTGMLVLFWLLNADDR